MRATIEQEVRNFIVENFLFGQEDILSSDDSFLEKGIIDSTGVLELVLYLERRYGIEVDSDELSPENFDSITRLANFINYKVRGAKPFVASSDESRRAEAAAAGRATVPPLSGDL